MHKRADQFYPRLLSDRLFRPRGLGRIRRLLLRLRLQLEAPAERQVEVDALHALLGLHPDERGAAWLSANCRCVTNRRSVLPTLNWVCTT